MVLLFLIYCFATQPSLVYSTPTVGEQLSATAGNLTALKTQFVSSWVQGPNFRSTSNILWSCIITLTACVYNALYLNIPPSHEGNWYFIWQKAKWVGLALLSPELVLFSAYRQLSQARKLVKELNELLEAQGEIEEIGAKTQKVFKESGASAQHSQQNLESSIVDLENGESNDAGSSLKKFPLKYGFLVVMGGIITPDIAKLTDSPNPPQTLTSDAVLFFARHGVFFDVSSEEITDKSKTNVLGKILICIQVIWFVIQVISRLVAGYPLTLIEVHTMVHVFCALVIYLLWWEKPQDISEPVSQSTSQHLDILAGLYVLIEKQRYREAEDLRYYDTQDVTRQIQELQTAYEEDHDQSHQILVIDNKRSPERSQICSRYPRPKNTVCQLVEGQALHSLIGPDSSGSPRYLSVKDVRRWNCLAKLLRRSEFQEAANKLVLERELLPGAKRNIWFLLRDQNDGNTKLGVNVECLLHYTNIQKPYDSLVLHEVNLKLLGSFNRPGKEFDEFTMGWFEDPLLVSILIIVSIAYGGIHLAVWNSQFASTQESLLWKVACIGIMTTVLAAWTVARAVHWAVGLVLDLDRPLRVKYAARTMGFFLRLSQLALVLLYFLSRLYLVVESFISLRHVPIGVYTTIPWVQIIPHI